MGDTFGYLLTAAMILLGVFSPLDIALLRGSNRADAHRRDDNAATDDSVQSSGEGRSDLIVVGRHVRSVSSSGIGSTECTSGCRVVDIADALSITIGGTSKLVDQIQNAGWCERSPNPGDGRSSRIRLTRPGPQLLTAARRTFTDEVGIRLGETLSTGELQRFAATVNGLRVHVHEQRRSA